MGGDRKSLPSLRYWSWPLKSEPLGLATSLIDAICSLRASLFVLCATASIIGCGGDLVATCIANIDQDAVRQIESDEAARAAKQAADRLVCEMWVENKESGRYQPVFARIEDRGGELRVIYRKAFREGISIKPDKLGVDYDKATGAVRHVGYE